MTITTSGTWIAPDNVASPITVLAVGGGAGGGGAGGGGGGGGGASQSTVKVTPGNGYAVTVGDGGSGGEPVAPIAAADGGASEFVGDDKTVTALGGGAAANGNNGAGGTGGAASGGTGDVKYSGGAGATSSGVGGGGGGGSASGAHDGYAGTDNSYLGGAGGNDGDGALGGGDGSDGNGAGDSLPGSDGTDGGGGGSGQASGTPAVGGNGSSGYVKITYSLEVSMTTTLSSPNGNETTSFGASSGTGLAQVNGRSELTSPATNLGVGSAANQIDRGYPFTGTVTAGTPFTINLSSGFDQLGNALGMIHVSRVHAMHQGTTGKITVGAGTHPVLIGDVATLQPGGSAVFNNNGVGYRVLTAGSLSGVSPVEALPVVDSTGSGTFTLTYMGVTTGAITYSSTVATLITNINGALDTAFGAGNLVASGATLAALIITGTSGNFQHNAFGGHFTATITGTGFTVGGAAGTSTTTTAGVEALSAQADTLTITADCGTVPFSLIVFGRSA